MHSLIHSFLTAGLEYKSSKNVNVVKMKKNTTCPLSSFPAQMLFRSYITVDVSSLMLGCLNCNYANTDCPLTRRIDNSTALAATARYGYGYLTTFEYAWENVRKFIIGFTLPLWNYENFIRFKALCIHYVWWHQNLAWDMDHK